MLSNRINQGRLFDVQKAIVLTSDNSSFDTCTLTAIQVLKTKDNVTQTIEIRGETEVTGLISFEAGNGQVNACRQYSIKEAQVIGGKLIRLVRIHPRNGLLVELAEELV